MRLAEIKPLNCYNKNCAKCLPAARVHEIVARWHGLRPLQTLWLERDLDPQDNIHVECHQDLKQLVSGYAQLQEQEYLQKVRSIPTRQERHRPYTGFNTDQKGRFHAAVTYIWLLNELRWALTNYTWPSRTFASPAKAAHTAMEHLSQQQHTSMLDELDQYAMYRFLYHHLLPVHGAVFADQDSAKLPLTFPSNMSTSTAPRFLQFFLAAAPVYLQPPDLIELTVRSRLSRKPPYPLMRLPSSTESWLHPVKLAYPFPVGVDLEAPIFPSILRHHFQVHLTVIARAFLSLTSDQSTRRANMSQVAVPCFAFEDHTYSWLMERVLKVFDEEARPKDFELPGHLPLTNSSGMLDNGWKDCMWAIWWWAGSEEKARAKMERWREIRRT
ncbi:hypothetical protein BS50DRAFT_483486 [Corynespora cassiicola Philippines]|uniref:Uncharacterized protein n=1 Tax=Corynespora cassiicola Philippines TaxID=1448308 RepID=A0A2T2P6F6_CORCC|nr:hypothetical protein BS50DRAFT_483486 [Corynespora cassiicola Philippines]